MGLLTDRQRERERMVRQQLLDRGVRDPRVLTAFRAVPRELFVGAARSAAAYDNSALPIDAGQSISQPYIVGVMVQALELQPTDRVLEVGAGSGYAAAIMAQLARQVHAIEWHAELATQAVQRLARLGIDQRRGEGR